MGVKISKRHSYSFKVFATKLLQQTLDPDPHKMFFLEFWGVCNMRVGIIDLDIFKVNNTNTPVTYTPPF